MSQMRKQEKILGSPVEGLTLQGSYNSFIEWF